MTESQDQSNDSNVPSVMEMAGTMPVDDLDSFVKILTQWHQGKVASLKHLLQVPPGATFEVDGKSITLTGTSLEAFKLAVELCLMQVGTLPFVAEMEDDPEANAKG